MATTRLLVPLLALALCSIAATPRPVVVPDIVTRGYHGIAVERTAEIGALHDVACVNYVVKQGDTMTSIARAVLGSEERVDEIADLNPDVDPRRMKIGSKLWLPPRRPDTEAPRRFAFYSPFPMGWGPVPLTLGQPLVARYASFTITLVPEDQLTAYREAIEAGNEALRKFLEQKKFELVEGSSCGNQVRDGSPVHRRKETVRIVRGENGRFRVENEVVSFDRDGKVVDENEQADKDGDEQALLLLLLAAAGGGAVLLRMRRASTRPEAALVTAVGTA